MIITLVFGVLILSPYSLLRVSSQYCVRVLLLRALVLRYRQHGADCCFFLLQLLLLFAIHRNVFITYTEQYVGNKRSLTDACPQFEFYQRKCCYFLRRLLCCGYVSMCIRCLGFVLFICPTLYATLHCQKHLESIVSPECLFHILK